MTRPFWPVLLLLALSCTPTPEPLADASPEDTHADLTRFLRERGYEAVPLQRLPTGHFGLRAHVDGAPLHLVVDTGAGHTVLDRGWAVQAGVVLTEQQSTATGLGGTSQRVALGTIRKVRIGPVEMDTMRVAVLDLSHANEGLRRAGQMPIHGIIGADFLHARGAVLDYLGPTLFVQLR